MTRFLADTNILLRSIQPDHPLFLPTVNAVKTLHRREDVIHVVPQTIYELWVVATRPEANNGLGWTPERTRSEVDRIQALLPLLPDKRTIYTYWLTLVTEFRTSGKPSHDARFVAAMGAHKITHLLTYNGDDFKRYPGITIVSPADV